MRVRPATSSVSRGHAAGGCGRGGRRFDASALVKRYSRRTRQRDRGPSACDGRSRDESPVGDRIVSALARRARAGDVAPADAQRAVAALSGDFSALHIVELLPEVTVQRGRFYSGTDCERRMPSSWRVAVTSSNSSANLCRLLAFHGPGGCAETSEESGRGVPDDSRRRGLSADRAYRGVPSMARPAGPAVCVRVARRGCSVAGRQRRRDGRRCPTADSGSPNARPWSSTGRSRSRTTAGFAVCAIPAPERSDSRPAIRLWHGCVATGVSTS